MQGTRKPWAFAAVLTVAALMLAPGGASAALVVGSNIQVVSELHFQVEAAIAVNPLDPQNIIVAAFDGRQTTEAGCSFNPSTKACEAWIGIYTSFDAGESWTSQLFPGYPGGPTGPLSGFDYAVHPGIAFDRNGSAYVVGNFFNSSAFFVNIKDLSIAVTRSDDGGSTWGEPTFVNKGQGGGAKGPHPQIAVDVSGGADDGTVYVTWQDAEWGNGAKDVLVAASRDHGASWSSKDISPRRPASDSYARLWSPHVAVGPEGNVYVAWAEIFKENGNAVRGKYWLTVSDDGGRSYSDARVVDDGMVPVTRAPIDMIEGSRPVVAVDSSNSTHRGRLYLTWADRRSGNPDILMMSSDDGGANWSAIRHVNQDSGNASQFDPWTSVAPDGRLDVAFYDRRDDANDILVNRYYARSTDGGASFADIRVSNVSSDPAVFPYWGEWNQIASSPSAAHLAWADTRNGNATNGNADIYTAVVSA